MIQHQFKSRYWLTRRAPWARIFVLCFFIVQSCNNGENKVTISDANKKDSVGGYDTSTTVQVTPGPEDLAVNKFKSAAEAEKEERQKMILMQIDSTYNAISLLDDAKNEMTSTSPAELTIVERNKKSKAIFNINILENELTRSLDASILANLRLRTNELEGITAELSKNVAHLQVVTQKLNKATACIGRLTNILALGLSQGIIKPFTPKGASVADVKATATAAVN